jgi:hypothetical protein
MYSNLDCTYFSAYPEDEGDSFLALQDHTASRPKRSRSVFTAVKNWSSIRSTVWWETEEERRKVMGELRHVQWDKFTKSMWQRKRFNYLHSHCIKYCFSRVTAGTSFTKLTRDLSVLREVSFQSLRFLCMSVRPHRLRMYALVFIKGGN